LHILCIPARFANFFLEFDFKTEYSDPSTAQQKYERQARISKARGTKKLAKTISKGDLLLHRTSDS